MRILFCSVPFAPSVGGIETVSALLAGEFARAGHEVVLVTLTAGDSEAHWPHAVVRRPSSQELLRLVRQADCVFHNNISLRLAWPLLLVRRPWIVAHHTWIPQTGTGAALKRLALRLATNISISDAMAGHLPVPSIQLPNPYRADLFRPLAGVPRSRDLVFVGRLVSDKGVDVLIDALALRARQAVAPTLTIVGDGPERTALEDSVRRHGIGASVRFTGVLQGEALVRCLNAHRAIVVPSQWEEPFGLVALEGLACGCLPIVARSGGLVQAGGPAARSFAKGDAADLAKLLAVWQAEPPSAQQVLERSAAHLARHEPRAVAARYLSVLQHGFGNGTSLAAS